MKLLSNVFLVRLEIPEHIRVNYSIEQKKKVLVLDNKRG